MQARGAISNDGCEFECCVIVQARDGNEYPHPIGAILDTGAKYHVRLRRNIADLESVR
jgi:hypothetical protein